MRISEVMTKEPLMVHSTCSVAEALGAARERGVEHLLVCDHGRIVGVACAQCQLGDARLDRFVGHYMVPTQSIDMSASLEEAAERLLELDQGMFLVENAGKPVGVATRGDLLRGGLKCDGHIRAQFFCASCGAHAHVHLDPHIASVAYCSSCMERAAPPGLMDDVGGGD
jgi:CBS domain-containing protein